MREPNPDNQILTVKTEHKKTIFALAELVQPETSGTALARHIIELGLEAYLSQNPHLAVMLADLQDHQASQKRGE